MSTEPLVTLGLAVRNGEPYLPAALECLTGQTYRHLEILIGDNASTDGTEEICTRAARRDPRVRYLRSDEDRGLPWNFNRLVRAARGRYFRWAAADDLIDTAFVERAVAVLEARSNVVLVYPKARLIDEAGAPLDDYEDGLDLSHERASERFAALHRRIGLCNAAYGLIRLDALRSTGLMGGYPGSDGVLLGELALHGRFVELPERMFHRRFHPAAVSAFQVKDLGELYLGAGERENAALDRLLHWRRLGAMLGSILRARCSLPDKIRAGGFLVRGAVRSRDEMARELIRAVGRGSSRAADA